MTIAELIGYCENNRDAAFLLKSNEAWSLYSGEGLRYRLNKDRGRIMQPIQIIACLNEDGTTEVLYTFLDEPTSPMPELETGMLLAFSGCAEDYNQGEFAIVVGNNIVYQDGDFISLSEYTIVPWDETDWDYVLWIFRGNSFDEITNGAAKLIWRGNVAMQ